MDEDYTIFSAKWGPLMLMQSEWWSDWWEDHDSVEEKIQLFISTQANKQVVHILSGKRILLRD